MQSLLVLASGVILLALCVVGSRAAGFSRSAGAILFIPVWFLIAAVQLWRAVAGEGTHVSEAFPEFLFNFTVPSVLALAVWWHLSTPPAPPREGRSGN